MLPQVLINEPWYKSVTQALRPRDAITTDLEEWAALMLHAQGGDRAAYRRLLVGITPYLRAIASRAHRNPSDAEDTVQDVLLTLHAVRRRCGPTRTWIGCRSCMPCAWCAASCRCLRLFPPQHRLALHEEVLDEILEERVASSRGRQVPRGVKRKMSGYPLRPRTPQPTTRIDFSAAIRIAK